MNILAVVTVVAGLAGFLGWAGLKPDGPQLIAKLKARIDAPRRAREEQDALNAHMVGLLDGLLKTHDTLACQQDTLG